MARSEDTPSILEQPSGLSSSITAPAATSLSGPHVPDGVVSPSSTSFVAEPAPVETPHRVNLPAQNIRFYGRTDVIEKIHDELMFFKTPGTIKTTVLYGLGGVGKTEIARAYAYNVEKSCDAIFWVSCESSMSLQEGFTAAALKLKLPGADAHDHLKNIHLVVNWLGTTNQRWLLILNNVDDPSILKGNIPTVGQGSIIITARNAQLFSELTSSLIQINPFSVEEGSQCLISLVGTREFNEMEELTAAKALTTKLGGHALGISQVAALIRTRGISIKTGDSLYENNQRSVHSFREIQTSDSSSEHDLTTLWSLQFESLRPASEALLGIMMFLSPDDISTQLFNLTPAADENQFLEDSRAYREAEAQLLDLSLAQKTFGKEQLSIHRLVQFEFGYFLEKKDPLKRQFAFEYAAKLLCRAFPKQIKGRPMYPVWSTCQEYYAHIISLGKHYMNGSPTLKKLRPTSELCEAISNCAWYLRERGAAELDYLLAAGLRACRQIRGPEEIELIYAHIRNTQGAQHDDRGLFELAIPYFKECLEIRKKYLDPADEELSGVLHNISLNHLNLKQYSQCLDFRQQSVDSINLMPDSEPKSNKLAKRKYVLGRCLFRQKHYEEARQQLEEALKELLPLGDTFMIVLANNALGNLKFELGDYAAAEQYFETAMQIIQKSLPASEARGKLGTLCFQAKLAIQLGQGEKAVRLLRSLMALMDTTAIFETQRARGYWMMSCAFQMLTGEEKDRVKHEYEYKNEIPDAGKLYDMAFEILEHHCTDVDLSRGITNDTFVGLIHDTFI
ncbi:P-loop containing nucleoside triphosphate hydrolase protein [Nemania abortiva]|nr:P-loop containing nucleoside triphosphate hydrolase protein [Nemania abortiva]